MGMAMKLSTIFLNHGFPNINNHHHNFTPHLPHRFLMPPITTCKMRQRNLSSSQHKRHQAKKVPSEPVPKNKSFESNSDDSADVDSDAVDSSSSSHQVTTSETFQPQGGETTDVKSDAETPINRTIQSIGESIEDKMSRTDLISDSRQRSTSGDEMVEGFTVETTDGADFGSLVILETETARSGEDVQPGDLIGMIKNAEKNILLLNEARIRALNDLNTVVTEKEALQGEITTLEMRLAESDARINDAAQEKLHVELLESQLEKLKRDLAEKDSTKGREDDENRIRFHSLTKELSLLRTLNDTLKDDIRVLKEELDVVKEKDKQILELEGERASLKDAVKNLESRLVVAQEDVTKLSALKLECRDLWAKVGHLQDVLDRATKQADEAVLILQQNSELRKKVDSLEKSLEEAQLYRLSSEKMQQNNELMQQKIRLLEEGLERSDKEVLSHVHLYEESFKEFQELLDNLKEERKKKALDKPVSDMPWAFWSRLLLVIDGWFLEKKISSTDAKLLKEMIWKRDAHICEAYLGSKPENESEILSAFLRLIPSSTSPGLHVVHIAAEMAPVAKVGGLGDVVSGLGKALQKKGHHVEIIIPKYDCMQYDRVSDLRALDVVVESYFDGQLFKNNIWVGVVEGLPVYLIEPQHPAKFFSRGQFYGERDDFKRFSYFSRAALELLLQSGKTPDIIHCHDWQAAFVAPLYWDVYVHKGLNSARICFTCHNFEYQGTAHASELTSCGLDVSQLNRPDRMQDNSSHDRVNPVKGAVVFSNIVTTVSPTYAQEVRTSEGGHGLHNTLNSHTRKFMGVLNGIDTDAWDPSTDVFLKVQFNADDIRGKMENKKELGKLLELSTADSKQPLVGCITRLVPQKGVHLIRHAIYRTMELGGQFVLLGSSPVEQIQREFEAIANQFQSHPNIRLILKYDEALSHSIYAASDMFIIPSIFEPCGLTQMIAMRYGAVPIVRKTGGLNDSVFDVDDNTTPLQFRNGFTFLTPDEQGVSSVLERAFHQYTNNRESWQQLVQRNMKIDFSWDSSASQYIELYENALARAKAAKRT